jgi:hypothetical protein
MLEVIEPQGSHQRRFTMAEKSARKNTTKTVAAKSLKEKRAAKAGKKAEKN